MGRNPYLSDMNGRKMLMVNDKPFFIFGGELHNSSASSLEYMKENVWDSLKPLNMNTVIAPVYWETIEPTEGEFDFSLPDGLIFQARENGMKLVLLWFGLWKNAQSTYPPKWIKKDYQKYFRVRNEYGEPLMNISPLCSQAVEADAGAFAKFMKHLREIDEEENTVIMVQIENEIGILGSHNDFSVQAQAKFKAEIPDEVAAEFKINGTWEAAFAGEAAENFMSYHYAKAVETIAARGRAEYNLPMYVNAWLEQFPEIAGKYPCGGPIFKMAKMWKLAAPTIDFFAPDIYVDSYRDVCDEYASNINLKSYVNQQGNVIPQVGVRNPRGDFNPLFIPEVRNTADAASFIMYAMGKHNAIGFSPFAIEDLFAKSSAKTDAAVLTLLNIGEDALSAGENAGKIIGHTYKMLSNMCEVIWKAHRESKINAFLEYNDSGILIFLEKYDLVITYSGHGSFFSPAPPKQVGEPLSAGFVIEDGDDIYLTGIGFSAVFLPKKGSKGKIEILGKEEGSFEDNKWIRGRLLNGDEGYRITFGSIPETQKLNLHQINF